MTKNSYLIPFFLIMAAVVIQFCAGNFPFHFFEFPLNVILGAIWVYSIYVLVHDNNSESNISKVIVSPKTTAFSLFLFICGTLVIGLFPQMSAVDAENESGLLGRLGFYNFMSSWIFVSILFILLSHLAAITIRGFKSRKKEKMEIPSQPCWSMDCVVRRIHGQQRHCDSQNTSILRKREQ